MQKKHRGFLTLTILTFLIIIQPFIVLASTDKLDSLKEVVSVSKEDDQTANALIALAKEYYKSRAPDSAIVYAEQALTLATRINYHAVIAESNYIKSLILNDAGKLEAAMAADRYCINISKKIGDDSNLGKGYYQMGIMFNKMGINDSSMYYLHESMTFNIKMKDSLRLIAMSNLMGGIFLDLSQYDSAVYYYMYAVKLAELSGKRQLLAKLYSNLGKTFIKLQDIGEARKYFHLSLKINQLYGDKTEEAHNLIQLGVCCDTHLEYDSAINYYDKARKIINSLDNKFGSAELFNNYAHVYENLEMYDSTILYLDKALELYREMGLAEGIMITLLNKGAINTKLGKYEQAEIFLDSSLAMTQATGNREIREDILSKLSINYYKSGNYKKAYEYQLMKSDLNDSIFDLDKTKIINELKQKYEKEQDQARILSLEKESLQRTIQRNLLFSAGLFILVVAVFGFIYFRQRIIKAKILAQQKLRQFEEEKKMMSARLLVEGQEEERKRIAMELHDGLGVLLSATKMQFAAVKEHDPENLPLIDKATNLLEQASKEARRISHNMMPGLLTKLGIYEAVEDIFENLNEMDSIEAICEIEGEQIRLPEKQEIMLYRIIQELTNNTLKYARAKKIELKLNITPSIMVMTYKDDGIGFDMKKVLSSSTTSLGLRSIELRIGFLNGEMKIDSSPGNGVLFTFRVPVEESLVVSR